MLLYSQRYVNFAVVITSLVIFEVVHHVEPLM